MCWFIHGALQGKVDEETLDAVNRAHACHIVSGTRHDLKMAIVNQTWDYRITEGCCDCESEIGAHDPDAEEVLDLAGLIAALSALPGAESLSLSKSWDGERNKHERNLKLSGLDLRQWLADLEPNTLYTVHLKRRTL